MFHIGKIFWMTASPDMLVMWLLVIGTLLLFTKRRNLGRALVAITACMTLAVWLLPLGEWLGAPLENRFPRPPEPSYVNGIVLLGGSQNARLSALRGIPSLTGSAERIFEFVALARRHPKARLVFTGGSGSVFHQEYKEADVMHVLFRELGFDDSRVLYEGESRNTAENASKAYSLVKPASNETWLLVTSALHMPRAVGAFRKAGWHITPWPVDYTTTGEATIDPQRSVAKAFVALDAPVREWLGLTAYYLTSKSNAWFPR